VRWGEQTSTLASKAAQGTWSDEKPPKSKKKGNEREQRSIREKKKNKRKVADLDLVRTEEGGEGRSDRLV